jgi:hypothetical protein
MKTASRWTAVLAAAAWTIPAHPAHAGSAKKAAAAAKPATATAARLVANDGWPESRAGAIGRHWIAAFNSGETAMKDFYVQEFSPDSLVRRSPEQRLTRYRDLKEKYGTLTFGSVTKEIPGELSVSLLDAETSAHEFVFAVETAAPWKLKSVSMREYRNVEHGGFHH